MTAWRIYILTLFALGSVLCRAGAGPIRALTVAEYRSEIDSLRAATQQLDSSGSAIPESIETLPHSWSIHTDAGDFEISSEGLRRDIRRYKDEPNLGNAAAIRTRLEMLRSDLDGFEQQSPDVSARRAELNALLARPEFSDVRGPNWTDRLKRWMLEKLLYLFSRLFRSSAIPTAGKYFVYGLIGLAGLALLYLVYRSILRDREMEEVIPKDLPVSAKEWTIWLSEARAASAQGDWREAIHLAYWAGISFLEQQGFWKPDRARTPREYLRLISAASEERETLTALTRIFELAWYAKRDASEATFAQTLEQLEKLGCR
jgi:hypothetical protein